MYQAIAVAIKKGKAVPAQVMPWTDAESLEAAANLISNAILSCREGIRADEIQEVHCAVRIKQ